MSSLESPSVLVISRSVGEGFSIGDDWHFHVADVNARFVTLEVTNGTHNWSCRLEADESLHISGPNTLDRRGPETGRARIRSRLGVRVARVTSNDARLAVHAPRTIRIHRHEVAEA